MLKKLFIITTLSAEIAGCGLFQAPPPIMPSRMNQNISRIASGTVVNTISLVPMDVPNPSQIKITNTAIFRVTDNVLSSPGSAVLIPQNALITGVYTNDGKSCIVSWQAVYANYSALEKNQAAISIAISTENTLCDPKVGIAVGQLAKVTFKK